MTGETDLLWRAVAVRFAERGWTEQSLSALSFRRDWALQRPNGLVATASVSVLRVERPGGQVAMHPGVSHGGVAGLRAALTLSAHNGELLREGPMLLQPAPVSSEVARGMVDETTVVAASLTDAFAGPEELLRQLGAKAGEGFYGAHESAFLLAGVLGDEEVARSHLAWLSSAVAHVPAASHQRFLRQAGRWLDAGMPAVPPIPEAAPRSDAPSAFWPGVLAALRDADAKHDAELRLARRLRRASRTRPLTTAEARRGLADDLDAHGVRVSPVLIAQTVDRVRRGLGLTGLVRTSVYSTRVWLDLAGRARTALETRQLPGQPAGADPPERAAYTYPEERKAWAEVVLDPDALGYVEEIVRRSDRRVGDFCLLTLWLERAGTDVAVMLGERRIGLLDDTAGPAFADVLHAAGQLDEAPRTHGTFLDVPEPVLCIPLPRR